MTGYKKWLASSKFQVATLCIALIYLQQTLYGLDPGSVADALVKIAVAYMGARVLEPIVLAAVRKNND